jgi:predicted nucleotidyltransferase
VAFVDRIADFLDEHVIAFALIGGEALAVRGVPRSTYDVDLLTVDSRVLRDDFWVPIRAIAEVEVRRGDFDDPLRGVVKIHPASERPVDIVVGRWKWERAVIERAESIPSDVRSIPVVRTADLILLKLSAGGTQDAWDIGLLLEANGERVIHDVEEHLADLRPDAHALWQRIRGNR